jgi:hypothetical protein
MFIGTGTIGTQAFTNAETAISTVGFTADVSGSTATGYVSLTSQSTSVWVSGVGTFQINEPTGISVQTAPSDVAPGTSVTQVIYLTISGQYVVSVTTVTTSPWDLSSTYFGAPVFGQTSSGSFGFNPPDGQLENWNRLPVLTTDGYTLNFDSTNGFVPMTFQAVLSAGVVCSRSPVGNVTDIQTVINEALGTAPATTNMNGDGVVNIVDVQLVTDSVLGCGVNSATLARFSKR